MSSQSIQLTPQLVDYIHQFGIREAKILHQLREATHVVGDMKVMQISPEQGQFMQLLCRLLNWRKGLEVGVFTGYSSLAVALAMPEDGHIVACDMNEEWTNIAKQHWQQAKVEHKIELRLQPAVTTLESLIADGQANQYDYAFIDADKENYPNYYELALQLIKPGGLILIDNSLMHGRVCEPSERRGGVAAVHELNTKLTNDERVEISMLPLGDGLTLVLKK